MVLLIFVVTKTFLFLLINRPSHDAAATENIAANIFVSHPNLGSNR